MTTETEVMPDRTATRKPKRSAPVMQPRGVIQPLPVPEMIERDDDEAWREWCELAGWMSEAEVVSRA